MTQLSCTTYLTHIEQLIKDRLTGQLYRSDYLTKVKEVFDLAWNDETITVDEYVILSQFYLDVCFDDIV